MHIYVWRTRTGGSPFIRSFVHMSSLALWRCLSFFLVLYIYDVFPTLSLYFFTIVIMCSVAVCFPVLYRSI